MVHPTPAICPPGTAIRADTPVGSTLTAATIGAGRRRGPRGWLHFSATPLSLVADALAAGMSAARASKTKNVFMHGPPVGPFRHVTSLKDASCISAGQLIHYQECLKCPYRSRR